MFATNRVESTVSKDDSHMHEPIMNEHGNKTFILIWSKYLMVWDYTQHYRNGSSYQNEVVIEAQ